MNKQDEVIGKPATLDTASAAIDKKPRPNPIAFYVDEETVETTDPTLTVRRILELAGLDPLTHYLIEIRGSNQIPHKEGDEELRVHEKQKFLSVFSGPTPVS